MQTLVQVMRGKVVESVHYGYVAVVNSSGRVIKSIGDPNLVTFFRSAAKPLQAIPLIESGAANSFGLTEEEIALVTASHSGERKHVEVAERFLQKIGLQEENLLCGIHPPQHTESAKELYWQNNEPRLLHNNCSGKHLGMLAIAKHLGFSLESYLEPEHPVQQMMKQIILEYSKLAANELKLGIDGCGVPVFALPLKNMALAYANLVQEAKTKPSPAKVISSMLKYPFVVAGTQRLCTQLMRNTNGRLIAKVGTEGIFCVGLLKEELGIAVKIADGNTRALGPTIIEVLAQLGLLTAQELDKLKEFHRPKLKNHRQEIIGQFKPVFQL